MSQSLTLPFPNLRRLFARWWADGETRSTLIGVLGVLLIHLLLWLTAPTLFRFEGVLSGARPAAEAAAFDIELAPDDVVQPQSAPDRFVETNPDAPENTPDRTTNFAAQNQQVAQEVATPDGASDRPALEGEADRESNQIVSGRLLQPIEQIEALAALEAAAPAEETAPAPRAQQNPLTGFEKAAGESEQTYGSNVAKIPENTRPIPERIEGAKDVPVVAGASSFRPLIDPKNPRPRPQVVRQQQVRPAILAENKFGTSNIGPIAVDARWSNYGNYLQRMIDTVQVQWERLLIESKTYPPSMSSVTVRFVMNSEGNIARILEVDSRSTEQAARACVSGITDRAPYGPWTEDMKAVLGEEQEMTFRFYYQ